MPNARSSCRGPAWLGFLIVLVSLAVPTAAGAQGFGARAGVSADPDQFYFGAHFETPPLVDRLHFRPNVEFGIGDSLTLVTVNFEFAYKIPIPRQSWTVYLGGGPAAVIQKHDEAHGGETDVLGGLNFLLGIEERHGLMFEVKAGVIDSPGFKFGVGYTWR